MMGPPSDRSLLVAAVVGTMTWMSLLASMDTAAAKGPPRTTDTPSDVHRYLLRPANGGTYVYDAPGFSALIAADGTVTFQPTRWRPRSRLRDVITGQGEGRKAEEWPVPLPAETRPTPYDDRERQLDSMTPQIPVAAPIFIDSGVRFDLTDEYARRMGKDPYRDAKAAFLADTFDFRTGLASRQHQQALAQLAGELEAISQDKRFSPPERRQIIYLIWQQASDDAAGKQARQIIQAFARKNFPPDEAARFFKE